MRGVGATVAGVLLIGAAPASAAFPGANGRLSYEYAASVMATAPAGGGEERERFRADHYFGSVDWQPRPR